MVEDWDGFMEDVKAQTTKDSLYTTWPNVCLWIEVLKNRSNYITQTRSVAREAFSVKGDWGCFHNKTFCMMGTAMHSLLTPTTS